MNHHRIFGQFQPQRRWKEVEFMDGPFDPFDVDSLIRERLRNQLEAFKAGVDMPVTEEPFNLLVKAGKLLLNKGLTVDEVLKATFTNQNE